MDHGGQFSNPHDRSAVVRSNSLFDASVTGRLSIFEFVPLSDNKVAATRMRRLIINRLNKFYPPNLELSVDVRIHAKLVVRSPLKQRQASRARISLMSKQVEQGGPCS